MAETLDERAARQPIVPQKDFVYSSEDELRAANVKLAQQQLDRETDPQKRAGLEKLIQDFKGKPAAKAKRTAKLADGTTLQFPADTTDEVIQQTVKRVMAERAKPRQKVPFVSGDEQGQHWWEHAYPREPGYEYGAILPYRKPVGGGKAEWAVPEVGKAAIDLFTGGGRALRGEEIQPEETLSDALLLSGGGRPPGRLPARIPEALKGKADVPRGTEPTVGALPEAPKPEFPPVKDEPGVPSAEFPPVKLGEEVTGPGATEHKVVTAEDQVKHRFQDFIDQAARRELMESRGQEILDDLAEAGTSPADVAKTFWQETYFKLPAEVQRRFTTMLKNLTGMEPGSAVAKNTRTGEVVYANDWLDVAGALDLPHDVTHLEGTERGFVTLMDEATRRTKMQAEREPQAPIRPALADKVIEPVLAIKDDLNDVYGVEKLEPAGIPKPRVRLHAGMTPEEQVAAQEEATRAVAKNVDVPPGKIKPEYSINGVARISDKQMAEVKAPPAANVLKTAELFTKNSAIRKKIANSELVTKRYEPKYFADLPTFNDSRITDMPVTVVGDADLSDAANVMRGVRSPHNVFSHYMGSNSNPVVDAIIKQMDMGTNLSMAKKWKNLVFKGVPNSRSEVEGVMRPFSERNAKLLKDAQDRGWVEEYAYLRQALEKNPKDMKVAAQLQNHPMNRVFKVMSDIQGEAMKALMPLAAKSESVRIALLAENRLPVGVPYTQLDLARAQAIQKMMLAYKERLGKAGIPTRDNYFINHLYNPMDTLGEKFGLREKTLDQSMYFPHRLGDFNWLPDAKTLVSSYLPNAERRLAVQPILNKYNGAVREDIGKTHPRLARALTDWLEANIKSYDSGLQEMGNIIMTAEYIKDIGFSFSTAVKHLTKTPMTVARQGFAASTAGIVENFVSLGGEALFRAGVVKGEPVATQLKRTFDIGGRSIIRAMDENPSYREEATQLIRRLTGNPTIAIEAFENGVTVLAEAMKGVNAGVPVETIKREIVNSVLQTNFRGGWDQATAQKNIAVRMLTMFKTTPIKIAENLANVGKGGVKGEREVALSWDAEGGMFTAEAEKSRRAELVRFVMLVGAVEGVARMNDTSVAKWMVDFPWVADMVEPTGDPPYWKGSRYGMEHMGSIPPLETIAKVGKRAEQLTRESPSDVAREALSEDLGVSSKLRRIYLGNIPPIYGDSSVRYLLGLPSVEALDRMGVRSDLKERKKSLFKRAREQ